MVLSSHTSPTMIKVISKKKGTYHILAPVQAFGVRQCSGENTALGPLTLGSG